MSRQAYAWAWGRFGLAPEEKLVLLSLADVVGDDGCLSFDVARLTRDCCMSCASVLQALSSLERRSLIVGRSNQKVCLNVDNSD